MDVSKMLAELRAEKAAVEEALIILERIARGQGGRRGRPPSYLSGPTASDSAPRKRKPFSEATKKKMRESQRKRWAKFRKEQKANS